MAKVSDVCARLQALQRSRAAIIKSRIMGENNRRAFVANCLGYSPGLEEKKRKDLFVAADKVIASVIDGTGTHDAAALILAAEQGIAAFNHAQKETEKKMLPLVKSLPVASWVLEPEQKGFGLLSLAVVVGEAGDLANYANPAKLWKRLGLAPFQKGDKVQMGATWKSKGGLTAEEWSAFGYSPRRRSIMFVVGENLLKQNFLRTAGTSDSTLDTDSARARPGKKKPRSGDRSVVTEEIGAAAGANTGGGVTDGDTDSVVATPGPYRLRYDTSKVAVAAAHPDYPPIRCHRHGMLLATKLLVKNLWKRWNPALDVGEWSESRELAAV